MHPTDTRIVHTHDLVHDAEEPMQEEPAFAKHASGIIVRFANAIVLHEVVIVVTRVLRVHAGACCVLGKALRVHAFFFMHDAKRKKMEEPGFVRLTSDGIVLHEDAIVLHKSAIVMT